MENWYEVIGRSLNLNDIRTIFGVTGIPVEEFHRRLPKYGISFIGCRNEQAAGYAAAEYSKLTLMYEPSDCDRIGYGGCLFVTAGPGFLHAIPGAIDAHKRRLPFLLIAPSMMPSLIEGHEGSEEVNRYSEGFHCLDQTKFLQGRSDVCGGTFKLTNKMSPDGIFHVIRQAVMCSRGFTYSKTGVYEFTQAPGMAYLEISKDVWERDELPCVGAVLPSTCVVTKRTGSALTENDLNIVRGKLKEAKRPAIIFGPDLFHNSCWRVLREWHEENLETGNGIPMLQMSTAKGILNENATKSMICWSKAKITKESDLVVMLGTPTPPGYQTGVIADHPNVLHFGFQKRRGSNGQYVPTHAMEVGSFRMCPDELKEIMDNLSAEYKLEFRNWFEECLREQVDKKQGYRPLGLNAKIGGDSYSSYEEMFDTVHMIMGTLRYPSEPFVVVEGATTLQYSRNLMMTVPTRMDNFMTGVMGMGLPAAMAAGIIIRKLGLSTCALAVIGDSAIGFSLAEIETIKRYKLPVVVIVSNNNGIYSGGGHFQEQVESLRLPASLEDIPVLDPCILPEEPIFKCQKSYLVQDIVKAMERCIRPHLTAENYGVCFNFPLDKNQFESLKNLVGR